MPGKPVAIRKSSLAEIYRHARETFPNECCGWLGGERASLTATRVVRAHNAYQAGAHPAAGERTAETAYVIAGPELLALSRSLDSDEPALVIYHSHPNGRAYFSDTDQAVAKDPWGTGPMYPVQQLVGGIDDRRVVETKLFAWDHTVARFVEIATFAAQI